MPRRQRDEVRPGKPPSLLERHRDDPHAAVGGLHHALRRGDRFLPELGLDLFGGQGHRVGVDDQPVDELGDVVDGCWQHPSGDVQAGCGRGRLHTLDELVDIVLVEEMGVVDDERAVVERVQGRRAELAAQTDSTLAGSAAHEPRFAVPGRCLEQHDAWDVGAGQPAQQGGAGKTHDVEESVSMARPVPRITALISCAVAE